MAAAELGILLVVIVVLVLLAGLFVAAEVSLTTMSRSRASELAAEGRRGSAALQVIEADRPRYVNVLLFLRYTCSTGATAVAAYLCLREFDTPVWVSLGISVVVMVLVVYVVLGVAPRTLAKQHADRVALAAAGPTRILTALLGPLASLLILVGNAITPGKGYRQGPFFSQAELREMLDQAGADSVIEDDERQMINSVFELGDTRVREVMVPRTDMVWIEQGKSLRQALSLGLRSGFSRIPVIGRNLDDVVGVVYVKDLARRSFENPDSVREVSVAEVMRPAHYVPDSQLVDDLLRELQTARVHLAIVVDEYGGTAGLVTIEDVLEEIVGEIADEYDVVEVPEVQHLSDGGLRVSARLNLEDFGRLVGVPLSTDIEGVDTVGGLLARRLGVVPIAGSWIDVGRFRLTAESLAGRRNRIGTVLVEPSARPGAEVAGDGS